MTWWADFNHRNSFLPNGLSIIRGILGCVMPFMVLSPDKGIHIWLFFVFFFAAMTDLWDGQLARKFNTESKLGKILDPSMDKILVLGLLAVFAKIGLYSVWWIVPIFIREIAITFCRIGWMLEGQAVGAEKIGKVKFVTQVTAIAFTYIYFMKVDFEFIKSHEPVFYMLMMSTLILSMILTLVSGITFMKNNIQHCNTPFFAKFASAMGVGLIPKAPGTWGSALGVVLAVLCSFNIWVYAVVFFFLIYLGHWAVSKLNLSDHDDPSFVVVDETCGMMLALAFLPLSFSVLTVGFVLFRFFDIVKPFPVGRLEKLHGYKGIMLDDLGAGIYTWLILYYFFI